MFASVAASVIRGEDGATGESLANIAPDEVAFTIGGKLPDRYLRFGWDARFVAGQERVPTGTDTSGLRYQAFNVHDIFLSWKPEEGRLAGYEFTARVDNIFDTNYQEYLQAAAPAKGRTFKATLAKTFAF
jgi:hemoglobin/transferrin/lactoferrin receptor protein